MEISKINQEERHLTKYYVIRHGGYQTRSFINDLQIFDRKTGDAKTHTSNENI